MRAVILADGQSPHARYWIKNLAGLGHEIHLISTYPCSIEEIGAASLHVVTLDFSATVRAEEKGASMGTSRAGGKAKLIARLRGSALWKALVALRGALTPQMIRRRAPEVRRIVEGLQPDIVQVMRIPYEGILAARALAEVDVPLLVSIWGNDFSLFAAGDAWIGAQTRLTLARADGLHPDARKDLLLGYEWGFDRQKPGIVLPGNGGVRTEWFTPTPAAPDEEAEARARWGIPVGAPVIVNPRGIKSYIRNDAFFAAIPLVRARRPDAVFVGAGMAGKAVVEEWLRRSAVEPGAFVALPPIPHPEMATLFRLATLTVSPSEHDGTPNTLLEAMASGAFPVAGDIPSTREWIEDGVNGRLVDPGNPQALADAIVAALDDDALRQRAAAANRERIVREVDHRVVTERMDAFWKEVIAARAARRGAKGTP